MKIETINIGDIFFNNHLEKVTVIGYANATRITIKFYDYPYERVVTSSNLIKGEFVSPYTKTVANEGYIGEYWYNKGNYTKNSSYKCWCAMIGRCYLEKKSKKNDSYKKIEVCLEWKCYENFNKWYLDNLYSTDEELHLDKDILSSKNKEYSPKTCILVPSYINYLFIDNNHNGLPKGVQFIKDRKKFRVLCNLKKNGIIKRCHIGYYENEELAFNAYKDVKESRIKEVAIEYKDKIPKKLYDAMMSYEIEC